jgi:hypothetical protein
MTFLSASNQRRIVLLSPARLESQLPFGRQRCDASRYWHVLAEMQRLRGKVYLEDGAIEASQLTSDGRHWQPMDPDSWHVLSVDHRGKVFGCARYRSYDRPLFRKLGVASAAAYQSCEWRAHLERAVNLELTEAARRDLKIVEVGGWALSEEIRGGPEALRIALAMYALAQLLGNGIGLTTATVRHCSSTILRKIGGTSLSAEGKPLPKYFDPRYQCEMEILRFDSAAPNPRYADWIDGIRTELSNVQIVSAHVNDAVTVETVPETGLLPAFPGADWFRIFADPIEAGSPELLH